LRHLRPPLDAAASCHGGAGLAKRRPAFRPISLAGKAAEPKGQAMTEREQTFAKVAELIEPFNKKGVVLTDATTFAGDLEWDSLVVMDFVASVEDEFDILITMNMQAEIENVGQLVDAIEKLKSNA
jgi:acyl carrier protein